MLLVGACPTGRNDLLPADGVRLGARATCQVDGPDSDLPRDVASVGSSIDDILFNEAQGTSRLMIVR